MHRLAVLVILIVSVFACAHLAPIDRAGLEAGLKRYSRLVLPDGRGPFPGLVFLSGCRGVSSTQRHWARRLRVLGYAVLIVDSMTPRGLRGGVCGDGGRLHPWRRAFDAWWGYRLLVRHPRIDPGRIGLMGWSHGGWTALEALSPRRAPARGGFKAAIVLYPYCGDGVAVQKKVPLLMLLAGRDDWCPPRDCVRAARRLKAAGALVEVIVFHRARHAFDNPRLPARYHIPRALRGRGATIGYHAPSARRAERAVIRFLRRYLR